MSAAILGLGTASPEHRLTQMQAARMAVDCLGLEAGAARSVEMLYRRAAVATRGSVLLRTEPGKPDSVGMRWFYPPAVALSDPFGPGTAERMRCHREFAPPLAEMACRAALADAARLCPGFNSQDVTHLIAVSCTGFFAPGLDYELIRRLGLKSTIQRFCIGFMGCHGGLNGLQLASALVRADPCAKVLLCCTELCSLHFQYGDDPGQITANALFADGSGAAVIGGPVPGAWPVHATGSCIIENTGSDMSWSIGDHGFEMHLSPRVPGLIESSLRSWLEPWLAGQGVSLEDIRAWAVHPGGPRILSAVAQGMALKYSALDASREVLREFGNMSSATVWFILRKLREVGLSGPCVMLGFGPGLMAEAALLEI